MAPSTLTKKRIFADIRELARNPSSQYRAEPLENNLFEWHFTIRGPAGTDFSNGFYHGRIILPSDYPLRPPDIIFLTPNGRFDVGKKICLSISAHHPEEWQAAWGIRLILEALVSFLPTEGDGALGALDYSRAERRRLANQSMAWCCPHCGQASTLLSAPFKAVGRLVVHGQEQHADAAGCCGDDGSDIAKSRYDGSSNYTGNDGRVPKLLTSDDKNPGSTPAITMGEIDPYCGNGKKKSEEKDGVGVESIEGVMTMRDAEEVKGHVASEDPLLWFAWFLGCIVVVVVFHKSSRMTAAGSAFDEGF